MTKTSGVGEGDGVAAPGVDGDWLLPGLGDAVLDGDGDDEGNGAYVGSAALTPPLGGTTLPGEVMM